ncbi:polymorphic toxin-type HINT domain-containing protein, partial [Moraxella catarrhalis]|uniref:polymorphic toxin-type HINT domain-containing protein n=1 Tax=Moraxella catarrhalis TaxID=480 RepID=UPI001D0D881D
NNLENALKLGLATALQSEAANHIKGLEDTDWILHKIAHAAAGCAAGALQKQCEAGAIGAAVGEVVAGQLSRSYYQNIDGDTILVLTDEQRNSIIKQSQLAASVIAAYSGYDAQIAANTAETSVENNAIWAAIPVVIYVVDKVYTAYQVYQDIKALTDGKTSVDKLAKEKGESYITQAIAGNIGKYGYKIIKSGGKRIVQAVQSKTVNHTCTVYCFTAGTLIHTTDGLKPIETITHGDLIWSRQEFGDEYDYRPVIATKATPNQEIYEVVVRHSNHTTETFKTTKEHPFWVEGIGWLKASLLEQGMTLLDKHGLPNVTIISQTKLDRKETVYNFEVQDFHTYHIGKYGVWVHNADCCEVDQKLIDNLSKPLSKSTKDHIIKRHDYNEIRQQIDTIMNKTGKSKQDAFNMLNLSNRTFFNKNWDQNTIVKATEYAKQDAIGKNVTSGNHTVVYRGEKITINISNDRKVSTAYGHYKYNINDF